MVLIYCYTRAQALSDGVLIDVTETALRANFMYPTALTRAVWEQYVRVPEGVSAQDEAGRLWDILWMLYVAIRRRRPHDRTDVTLFQLYVRNDEERLELVLLKALCGPGDDGEPVLTVMLPDED